MSSNKKIKFGVIILLISIAIIGISIGISKRADNFVVIASNLPATPSENSFWDSTTTSAFCRIEVKQ